MRITSQLLARFQVEQAEFRLAEIFPYVIPMGAIWAMASTTEITLVLIPMALYLYLLGIWHGGKHPRLVSGQADLAGLIFSLSGLVAFGPVGHVVVGAFFGPNASAVAWSIWLGSLVLIAGFVARSGRNRLVIYHVPPDQIHLATRESLPEFYLSTLHGFEDAANQTSLQVRVYPWMRTATIEANGTGPGRALTLLRPLLRAKLREIDVPVSTLSTLFFTASALVMVGPVVGYLFLDPQGRKLVRTVGRWVGWG